jgi:hypothetical protein
LTSQVAKYIKKAKLLLFFTDLKLKAISVSLSSYVCRTYNTYLNINMHWDIAYSVGIQEQLPSNKTDIHLTRQSAYMYIGKELRMRTYFLFMCECKRILKTRVDISHNGSISAASFHDGTALFENSIHETGLVDRQL